MLRDRSTTTLPYASDGGAVEYLISPGLFGVSVRFEEIEHTADVGIRAYGKSASELFEGAAAGMFSLIANPERVRPLGEVEVRLAAEDLPGLLVAWLSELLFLHETQRLLFCKFRVEVSGTQLHAQVWGEAIDKKRHELKLAIKAVTYHRLSVDPERGVAEVIFDA
jgi:SHS2 domain-containing protein